MRHVLYFIVAAVASLLVVIGWKPILGLETFRVDIQVTALGVKNPQSTSAEVWLRLAGWPNGVTIDRLLETATPPGGWEKRDDAAVSYQNQPAQIEWQGSVGPDARLVLTRHDWSGDVSLRINGTSRNYDLYAPPGAGSDLVIRLKEVPAVFRDSLLSVPGTILPTILLTISALAAAYALARAGQSNPPRS